MMIKSKKFVIQKYIERPLLVDKKKFDIRLYVMVSPSGKIFQYKEMYIRVSAYDFDLNNMQKFGHLNNIALQKYSNNYDGEKAVITTKKLEEYVQNQGHINFSFDKEIRPKLSQIISILSVCLVERFKPSVSTKKSFEIFGLDFMIDEDFGVWLIEANTNPALSTGNSYLDQLIPRMMDDAWKITLDKMFPLPKENSDFEKFLGKKELKKILNDYENIVFPLLEHDDQENLWDLISKMDREKGLKSNPN